jgi:hypothetical protein
MRPIAHQDQSREAWRPGVETRMLVSVQNGATALCLFEQWVAPGNGAPTHRHPVEEVLMVREGEADMWIEDSRRPPARLPQQRQRNPAPPGSPRVADLRGYRGWCDRGRAALGGRRSGRGDIIFRRACRIKPVPFVFISTSGPVPFANARCAISEGKGIWRR